MRSLKARLLNMSHRLVILELIGGSRRRTLFGELDDRGWNGDVCGCDCSVAIWMVSSLLSSCKPVRIGQDSQV